MKKTIFYFACLVLVACTDMSAPVVCEWEFGKNDVERNVAEAYLTITNLSGKTLENDWTLYYCLEAMTPIHRDGEQVSGTQIQGSYHCFRPTENYRPIPKDSSRTYCLRFRGNGIRENKKPEGMFFISKKYPNPISIECTSKPYTRREQMFRGVETWEKTPYADGEYMYSYIAQREAKEFFDTQTPFFPQPKQVVNSTTPFSIENARIVISEDNSIKDEGYRITLSADTVHIYTSSSSGEYYARQILTKISQMTNITLINDYPDLHHRGIMLDIVRNFYPKDSVLRVLDVMADLKLNVLHFHISDDEAWRVEIPGLPQLTTIGARRGYTTDEKECLFPMYCGGWDYNDKNSTANGFLTREDFIEILRFANERHIRVIPEVDMPGHMRACKKALYPLLSDSLMDTRSYYGAQEYTDNVIAVNKPYALIFIESVVSEFKKMYDEAGAPFTIFNIGGDEVPQGALTYEEHQTFIDGVVEILSKYNLTPMGWEEITEFCKPETKAICYSWHNGEEKPQQMADAGYPVVLATANHLYFDFAYNRHHEEKGLDWGGYTDEYSVFDWIPLQHPNIIGMNAQLWAEPIRSFSQIEWQLYPKMFGLSERAWNNNSTLTLPQFTSLVYNYALPKMNEDKHNFHLQQPGIHYENDTIYMNSIVPAEIEYSLDGGNNWLTYTKPFRLDKNTLPLVNDEYGAARIIKAKMNYLDHTSNTTWLWINE